MATKKMFFIFISIFALIAHPLNAFACSTCGCSELCPIAMMEDEQSYKAGISLSESLWGNIILKMAYQRDEQLQKLSKHVKGVNALTSGTIAGTVGGTLGQNIVSVATINPPDGQMDSYLPGSIGLGLSGIVNVVFDGNMLINWRLKKKIRARQLVVREKVETILSHLEYSKTDCPDAQSDLTAIIGKRAASDCLQLWRSSHATVYAASKENLSSLPDLKTTL